MIWFLMRTWKELEEAFRTLHQSFDAELQHQTGDAGEYWRIIGPALNEAERFKSLAAIAGAKVLDLAVAADWPEVIQEQDPTIRWYRCLKRVSGNYETGVIEARTVPADGYPKGERVSMGRLNRRLLGVLCPLCEAGVVRPGDPPTPGSPLCRGEIRRTVQAVDRSSALPIAAGAGRRPSRTRGSQSGGRLSPDPIGQCKHNARGRHEGAEATKGTSSRLFKRHQRRVRVHECRGRPPTRRDDCEPGQAERGTFRH
jgi:hypothetical protein